MKNNVLLIIALLGFVGLLTGCQEVERPEPTYYQFDARDKAWLTAKTGDEWTFQNQAGVQRRFRVGRTLKREHLQNAGTTLGGGTSVNYYYDEFNVYIERVDSAIQVGSLTFAKGESGNDGSPALVATGFWYEYIGPETQTNGVQCQLLNFPTDLNRGPFSALTVNDRLYSSVLTLEVPTRRAGLCTYPFLTKGTHVYKLHYDRQYGIIRLQSITGEVWTRVL